MENRQALHDPALCGRGLLSRAGSDGGNTDLLFVRGEGCCI